MEATLKIRAGRLFCGTLRDFLSECKFNGIDIRWIESSGWLERDFIIKGNSEVVLRIKQSLDKWIQENNLG